MLATVGVEFGRHAGLGWIAGEVVKITPIRPRSENPAHGLERAEDPDQAPAARTASRPGAHAYFVHSFELKPTLPDDLIATTDYGGPLTAMVGNENIAGTQFHPEKSQATGIKLLENFLSWRP